MIYLHHENTRFKAARSYHKVHGRLSTASFVPEKAILLFGSGMHIDVPFILVQ